MTHDRECLTLALTDRCPLACPHCGTESSPRGRAHLDLHLARAAISEAGETGVRVINFSGGEPLVRPAVLISLVQQAHDQGSLTRVTTGCAWAITPAHARRTLAPLAAAGLDQLFVSSGDFHQQEISIARVVHAAGAAWRLGVEVVAVSAGLGPAATRTTRLRQAFERHGLPSPPLLLQPFIPAGRAENLPLTHRNLLPVSQLAGPCPALGRHPTLHADGSWTGCASLAARGQPLLKLGSGFMGGIAMARRQLLDNPLWTWLATLGPLSLRDLLQGSSAPAPDGTGPGLPNQATGLCHLCREVLKHPGAGQLAGEWPVRRPEKKHVNPPPARHVE